MKIRKYLSILFIVILSLSTIVGCSAVSKAEKAFNTYKEMWSKNDYKSMYSMLSSKSKEYISEEAFIERYTNIYGAIDASNITLEINGEKEKVEKDVIIPYKITMDTIAGNITEENKVTLVKEDKEYRVNWNESYIFSQMQAGDKVRVKEEHGRRGSILDSLGNPLAMDGFLSVVGIHPSVFDATDREKKITELSNVLDISEDTIVNKLNENTNPEYFVQIVDILSDDAKLNKLKDMKIEGVLIEEKEGRVYTQGEAFGSLIGYIGEITAEELEKNKGKGYSDTSLIGKAGLEQVYEETLRGNGAVEIYLERGDSRVTLFTKESQVGKDIKLSIDTALQNKIYAEMGGEKGAATAVNPKTGEVIAMVSSPSYNSNVFTTYLTKTQKSIDEANNGDDEVNRFKKVYSPGSTMKLITSVVGLENGVIKAEDTKDIKGLAWQKDTSWGDYKVTRVTDPGRPVNLRDAVNHSDNIYYAQVALDLGADKMIGGIKKFGIGEELTFEYPMDSQSQISNDGTLQGDIKLADTGYGQGELMVTPLNIALAYSSIANNGDIMQPRLVISENSDAKVWKPTAISADKLPIIKDAFTALINDGDGTVTDGKVEGFRVAGKTGTAEIKKSQEDKEGTENGWFVSVDPDSAKISLAMIIENVKGRGGSHLTVPKVRNVMEYYLKR